MSPDGGPDGSAGRVAARILVVDDEPDVEALVSQRFRRQIRKGEMDLGANRQQIDRELQSILAAAAPDEGHHVASRSEQAAKP